MKKILFGVAIALLLGACVSGGPNNQTKEEILPVVSFVDSFRVSHPNWENNSVTKEKANEDYLEMIKDTTLLYSLADGIDVKLSGIRQNKDGKYTAYFTAWHAQSDVEKHNISKVMFDVVTTINDSLVSSLKENEEYKCKWNIVGALNYETFCFLYGQQVSTICADPKIELEDYTKDVSLSLGLFYADLKDIKPKRQY